jgi:hypothetical protein
MSRRVFVSQVSDDPDTEAVLDGLCGALEKAGFDVLVDTQRLRPGASWRQEIYAWLGLCHVAVVLISRRAVDDPAKFWVARETALLAWRRALDPSLRILPVLLPGVEPRDLSAGRFADLLLPEIQCVRAAADPASTARLVLDGLGVTAGAPTPTPLDALAGRVAARLRGIEAEALEGAAADLAVDLGPWRPDGDPRRDIALALLCAPLERAARAGAPCRLRQP